MLHDFRRTILFICRTFVFAAEGAVFFLLFSLKNPYLIVPSRTSAVTLIAFTLTYFLMTRIYGGFAIGIKKSKPIIFSLFLTLLAADLAAHLVLCIMNVTVVNGGKFVYEQPLLLLLVITLQTVLLAGLTYAGNGVYFLIVPPQRCLLITPQGESEKQTAAKIAAYRRQYRIENTVSAGSRTVFDLIDRCDAVFLCGLSAQERLPITDYCFSRKKEFYYTLEMADIVSLGAERVMFSDTSMMHSSISGLSIDQRAFKRFFDIIISLAGLLILSPLMLATALAIKLEDGGHVFYRQKRATYRGRVFDVLKFRSMREEDSINRSVTKDDDRITKIGRVIRRFRIDELPQFINVLRGDMSLIGPRPEMLENVERYTSELPEFSYRLWVKAGLTGMAQVYGKYNTSPKEKLILDMLYISQYSILLDIKILFRTLLVMFTPDESTEAFDDTDEDQEK